jgi:teichuronic acid biosynthesis glycosyltransferase TuaG
MRDLVSVITPCYNSEKYIAESIESVIKQTYTDWELIIINDKSSDLSSQIISEYTSKDNRIKSICLKNNSGAAIARNEGLKAARGKYIAFIDSDDIWFENKLEKQIKFMEDNDVAFSFTAYESFKNKLKNASYRVNVPRRIMYKQLLRNTIIGCSTVIINREKTGNFTMPLIRAGQDTATWLSILKYEKYAYGLDIVLTKYRIVRGSVSNNKFKALRRTWKIYRNVENLNLIYSLCCFLLYIMNNIKKRIFIKYII